MSRLKRVRYGDVFLPSKLKKGQWLELPQRDVDVIYQMAGLPNREVAPLSRKEQERRERYAKKGQRATGRRSRRQVGSCLRTERLTMYLSTGVAHQVNPRPGEL